MANFASTVSDPTSTSVKLSVAFFGIGVGSVMYPAFSDGFGTTFMWNPTTPYTTIQYSQYFGEPVSTLADEYLNIVVMNNVSTNVWAWPSMTGSTMNTFAVPVGYLTLYGLLNAMYNASKSDITSEEYQDITGFAYQGSETPTVADALNDYASNQGYTPQVQSFTRESNNVFRVSC